MEATRPDEKLFSYPWLINIGKDIRPIVTTVAPTIPVLAASNDPTKIILKVGAKKQETLDKKGMKEPPTHCDLILFPKQIYQFMVPDLVRQAKGWVDAKKQL